MEVGSASEEFGIGIEGETTLLNDGFERLDCLEVFVGDRIVEYRPKTFGRLELGRVGRRIPVPCPALRES